MLLKVHVMKRRFKIKQQATFQSLYLSSYSLLNDEKTLKILVLESSAQITLRLSGCTPQLHFFIFSSTESQLYKKLSISKAKRQG